MEYIIDFKIPNKEYLKVFRKNYPDVSKIIGECYFMLVDTYGLPKKCILDFHDKVGKLIKQDHIVKIPVPKGWIK